MHAFCWKERNISFSSSHQFTLSLIFSSLRSSVRFQRPQRPISRRRLGAETVLCSPTHELQPRKSRRRGACRVLSPASRYPTSLPGGRRRMKRRNRDGEVLPSGRGAKAARLEDVKMSDGRLDPARHLQPVREGQWSHLSRTTEQTCLGGTGLGWRCGLVVGVHSLFLTGPHHFFPPLNIASVGARLRGRKASRAGKAS